MKKADSTGADWLESMAKIRQFPHALEGELVSSKEAEIDGMVRVGWDLNADFPAYHVASQLVPFTPLAQRPPPDGDNDWYIDNFTDEAIKARWQALKTNPDIFARINALRDTIAIPHQFRATGSLHPIGQIESDNDVDLRAIRRPQFFAAAPWHEPIAGADSATTIIEVCVPREPYERYHLNLHDPIYLRGWHMAGSGVDDGKDSKIRALIIMIAGRSIETTAIQHPHDKHCAWDEGLKIWVPIAYPNELSECGGARSWRNNYLYRFWQAGFDVLTLDKRGHGISGGDNDSNCNEQANDIFLIMEALETGQGLRLLLASGDIVSGDAAAGVLLTPYKHARDVPLFLSGASQGSMVSMWAMHKNFVGACDFDRDTLATHAPLGYNIKSALLLAPFSGCLGYRPASDDLAEASRRSELNVQMFPSSDVLKHMDRWPSLFLGRGVYDFAESLEGTFAAYKRVQGAKKIVVVRGPHSENDWGQANINHMSEQMITFATQVLADPSTRFPEITSLKALVQSAPDIWPEHAHPLS